MRSAATWVAGNLKPRPGQPQAHRTGGFAGFFAGVTDLNCPPPTIPGAVELSASYLDGAHRRFDEFRKGSPYFPSVPTYPGDKVGTHRAEVKCVQVDSSYRILQVDKTFTFTITVTGPARTPRVPASVRRGVPFTVTDSGGCGADDHPQVVDLFGENDYEHGYSDAPFVHGHSDLAGRWRSQTLTMPADAPGTTTVIGYCLDTVDGSGYQYAFAPLSAQ